MVSKKVSQKKHAKKRFNTRVGISLTDELHTFLVNKIQKGEGQKVEKQSNRVSIWDINVKNILPENEDLRVVYDKSTKNIVTILYKDGFIL